MDGFGTLEVTGRVVLANNRLAVGALKLGVGELTESVSVTARGETVASTSTTSHQAVMDLKQVDEPLDSRPRPDLAAEDPAGRAACWPTIRRTFGGSFATPVPQIQGGRGQTIYVDGINGGDGGGGAANFSGADQPGRDPGSATSR